MIRAMRATDAMALTLLGPRDRLQHVAAGTWPHNEPEGRRPTLWSLLRDAALAPRTRRQLGVALSSDRPVGVVVLQARAGGLAWDVEHLGIDGPDTGVELLRWARERAARLQARKLFLHTPGKGSGSDIARRAGFERYTEGVSYCLAKGFSTSQQDSLPARPRLRSDEPALFDLYMAAVPANVRAAEALTHEEWAALYPGKKLWAPSVLGDQDYVWEIASRVVGWMRVVFGDRSQFIHLLTHPLYDGYADKMLQYALTETNPKAPVVVEAREYQTALRGALERVGFEAGESYAAWVCQIAVRATQPGSAPVHVPAAPV